MYAMYVEYFHQFSSISLNIDHLFAVSGRRLWILGFKLLFDWVTFDSFQNVIAYQII